jgi:hypothetical protein
VTHFGVWRLVAVLVLGLAACSEELADPPPLVLEPGGGFKAEQQDGVKAGLKLPDRVSPDAALIQAEVSLVNTGTDVAVVTVSRPCDVHDWVIRDAAGKLLMTKGVVECVEQPATKALAPGSTLSEKVSIYLMPRALASNDSYTVEYRFWGQPATAKFTARR